MQGISALDTLLDRFSNGNISVEHVRLCSKYKSQLIVLCEEIDKARKRADPQYTGSHAALMEQQLKDSLSLIKEVENKKSRLHSLFGLCASTGINIGKWILNIHPCSPRFLILLIKTDF